MIPPKLSGAARDWLNGQTDDLTHVRGRQRLLEVLQRPKAARARRISRYGFLSFAAALALCVGWLLWPRAELTLSIDGGDFTQAPGGVRIVTDAEASVVRFSDGSHASFAPHSSGRIDGVRANGARVILASGTAHFAIAHERDTSWSVEAGPYVVRVIGTEFDVTWDPAAGQFLIVMQQGSVSVEGPMTPHGVALASGQHLAVGADNVVRLGEGAPPTLSFGPQSAAHYQPEPTQKAADADRAAAAQSAHTAAASTASASSSAPASVPSTEARAARQTTWAQLVSDGKYADVVSAARTRGLDSVAETASLDELIALADAARYSKDGAAARAALEAQRKRFKTTQAGRSATFLLGRLAEDGEGSVERAIALYDEYLALGGPFAAEALGRKMLAVRRSKGVAAAKPLAQVYLETHPNGAYAAAAASIVAAM